MSDTSSHTVGTTDPQQLALPAGVEVTAVRPGGDARRELHARIEADQAGDPLAPVTIVAVNARAQVDLRRRLSRTGHGLANVHVLRLTQLADRLAGDDLPAPLTEEVHRELVRHALARSTGPLSRVAHSRATHDAVARTLTRLRAATALDATLLDRLEASGGTAAEIAELFLAVRDLAKAYADQIDRDLAAAERVAGGRADLGGLGPVHLHLVDDVTPTQERLLDALSATVRVRALVSVTGDPDADAATTEAVRRHLRAELEHPGDVARPEPELIVTAPDAVEEARAAARHVLELLDQGVEAERIGVLYRCSEPYGTVVPDVLTHAGIPVDGAVARTLAHTPSGRTLLELLAWQDEDHDRDRLLDWLRAAPVQVDGRPAPVRDWTTVSAEANVTRGRRHWDRRLRALAARSRAEAAEGSDRAERCEAVAQRADELRAYTGDLIARLDDPADRSWTGWADWAVALVEHTLGPVDRDDAADVRSREAIAGLAQLDAAVPPPDRGGAVSRADVWRVLRRRLGEATPDSRAATGVRVGRVDALVGVELDHVVFVGAVEGSFPTPVADDPLLRDDLVDRVADGTALTTTRDLQQLEHRRFATVLAAAESRVVTWSRVDRRQQRAQVPAPWLLASAGRKAAQPRPLSVAELEATRASWYRDLVSHHAAVATATTPLDATERRLTSALSANGDPAGAVALQVDDAIARALSIERTRSGLDFSEFDAHVGPHPALDAVVDGSLSPTALEAYGGCPRSFLFKRVLRIGAVEDPREPLTVSPRDRGNIVHDVLERYVDEVGEAELTLHERRDAVDRIAVEVLGEAELRWAVGRGVLWSHQQQELRAQLQMAVTAEDLLRREHGTTITEAEVSIGDGPDDPPAVTVALPSGQELTFKGRIDRLDRDEAGGRVIASDYKTGGSSYKTVEEDPVVQGTVLQGAVYALLAEQRHPGARVRAQYWSVNDRVSNPRWATRGFELDEQRDRILAAFDLITEGIRSGVFPATPGEWNDYRGSYDACTYCAYDRICAAPGERERGWERDRQAAATEPVRALHEGRHLLPVLPTPTVPTEGDPA